MILMMTATLKAKDNSSTHSQLTCQMSNPALMLKGLYMLFQELEFSI
jgi:hypothetical protein